MRAIFISDLHLCEQDSATHARFDAFIREAAQGADVLYILGDLLHVWLGDALLEHDAYAQGIVSRLKSLANQGTTLCLARGNRDFMIGERFAQQAGATLLAQQTVISLGGERVLLMHGDELCTDDVRYQRMRRILRADVFRSFGNALPKFIRLAIASKLRVASDLHKAQTAMTIMDANANAIDAAMHRHQVQTLIHGHTHRPAQQQLDPLRQRWVLSDWQQDYGYLEWEDGRFSIKPWPKTPSDVSI